MKGCLFRTGSGKTCPMKSRSSHVRFGITIAPPLPALAANPPFALDTWTRLPADGFGLWTDGTNWTNGLPPNGPGNEEGRIDNGGTAVVDISQYDPFTA